MTAVTTVFVFLQATAESYFPVSVLSSLQSTKSKFTKRLVVLLSLLVVGSHKPYYCVLNQLNLTREQTTGLHEKERQDLVLHHSPLLFPLSGMCLPSRKCCQSYCK